MTRATDNTEKSSDILSSHSSDDTAKHGVYVDTRSKDGHFSTKSTQSGMSTYAPYEAENIIKMPGCVLPRNLNENIIDSHTDPDRQSNRADD